MAGARRWRDQGARGDIMPHQGPPATSRRALLAGAAGSAILTATKTATAQDAAPSALTLWYRQPAEVWTEALPIGNGRLGAMVFGGVAHERLQLNEDTLW